MIFSIPKNMIYKIYEANITRTELSEIICGDFWYHKLII